MLTNTLKAAFLTALLLALMVPATAQRQSAPRGQVRMEPPIQCCGGLPMPERPIPPKSGSGVLDPLPPAGTPHAVPAAGAGVVPDHAAKIGAAGSSSSDPRVTDNRSSGTAASNDSVPTDQRGIEQDPLPPGKKEKTAPAGSPNQGNDPR